MTDDMETTMQPVRVITGTAVPLDRSDVDTDQIIPAHWLRRVERTGFGVGRPACAPSLEAKGQHAIAQRPGGDAIVVRSSRVPVGGAACGDRAGRNHYRGCPACRMQTRSLAGSWLSAGS